MTREELKAWLEARTREGDGDCLIWARTITSSGFPSAAIGGKSFSVRTKVFDVNRPGQRGKRIISMRCGDQRCLNLGHMELKTLSEIRSRDVIDRLAKNPHQAAKLRANAPLTKLNEQLVGEIRMRLSEPGITQRQVAREYGLSYCHVSRIWRGEVWPQAANGSSVFAWRPAA